MNTPEEQVRLKALEEAMDHLSRRMLSDSYMLTGADHLADACDAYLKAHVKYGPESKNADLAAQELVRAIREYRERRGLNP